MTTFLCPKCSTLYESWELCYNHIKSEHGYGPMPWPCKKEKPE